VPRATLRDYVKRLFGRRVYRCAECGRRFHDRPSESAAGLARRRIALLAPPVADLGLGALAEAMPLVARLATAA
jgi:hypothetical protein